MSNATKRPSAASAPKRRAALADFFVRLWKEKRLGTVSGIIILILILVAIFADVLAPYPYNEVHLIDRLQGPSAQYPLGTDGVRARPLEPPDPWGLVFRYLSVWRRPLSMFWSPS